MCRGLLEKRQPLPGPDVPENDGVASSVGNFPLMVVGEENGYGGALLPHHPADVPLAEHVVGVDGQLRYVLVGTEDVGPKVKVRTSIDENRDVLVDQVIAPPVGREHPARLVFEEIGGCDGVPERPGPGRRPGRYVRAYEKGRREHHGQR